MSDRKMPSRVDLGKQFASTMAHAMGQRREFIENPLTANPHGLRTVMGFCLPSWQRGLVWTREQKVSFIESAWRGINLGTYTYNVAPIGHPLDNLLIDGQQRMNAIECYLNDEFPVFGCLWSEVSKTDERVWSMTTIFGSYVTETTEESYLRSYYNLTNFGGTPHQPDQRAA